MAENGDGKRQHRTFKQRLQDWTAERTIFDWIPYILGVAGVTGASIAAALTLLGWRGATAIGLLTMVGLLVSWVTIMLLRAPILGDKSGDRPERNPGNPPDPTALLVAVREELAKEAQAREAAREAVVLRVERPIVLEKSGNYILIEAGIIMPGPGQNPTPRVMSRLALVVGWGEEAKVFRCELPLAGWRAPSGTKDRFKFAIVPMTFFTTATVAATMMAARKHPNPEVATVQATVDGEAWESDRFTPVTPTKVGEH